MERRAAIALGILLACCPYACALNPSFDINQYAHTPWTARDGLFKGVVSSIAQTSDGYLWLGTEFGLLRFDGVRTSPWQPPAGQQLPNNRIRTVLVARDGRLWIGTWEGLASWKSGTLTIYPELAGQIIYTLNEDRTGAIWASGGEGTSAARLCAIRSTDSKCYGEDGSLSRGGVTALYEDRAGNLWAGAEAGLWRWQPGPPKLYPLPAPGVTHSQALIESGNGPILIAMPGGIRQLVDGKVEVYPLQGTGRQFNPHVLLRDRNGGLWIGTSDHGLLHVHEGRTDLFAQSDGLSGNYVQSLFEDREGNIWVSTLDGLDRFRDLAVSTISVKQGLSNDGVLSVLAATDGSVWLGTRDGLDRWDDGRVSILRKGSSGLQGNPQCLFQDESGRIWVSTIRGFGYLDNGRFIPVVSTTGEAVHSIAGDSSGNLWISQDQALFHLLGGSVVERLSWAELGRKAAAATLLPDPAQGGLWLGFYRDGLAFFKNRQVRALYAGVTGSGEDHVNNLYLDRDGKLWTATEGGLGLVKDGHVATLTNNNGLPCDDVHWVMQDDSNSFWLYTACGVVRIARTELDAWATDARRMIQVTVFDSSDGVISHSNIVSAYSPRVAKTKDGKLWFLGGDGVSVIDPRHLPFNKLPPPVHIEQIIADGKTYETSSKVSLPPLVRDMEVDYTALSLVAPEKNRFRYKLEGRDRDWLDAGTRRQAFYSDLAPRYYRFRVLASNNSGVWNEAGASFDFSIAPAYYQTSWFRASCGVAFLALLWGLYRYRLHQIAREFNVRLDERVGERTRLARDLHDTLLQGFQGLMLRLQALDDLLPQGEAKEELEQTLDRADQVVTESRKAVHDLRLSAVVTNDLARAVKAIGDELSSEGSATFELLVEGETRELHPIVRDEVYRITREALRNAFSHARANHIEAEITYGEQLFRLRIRDDGEGIAPEILEDGRVGHYGLPGMRERAAEMGGTLDIWSGIGAGTEIDLSVPGSIAYGKRPGRSRLQAFFKKEV